MKSLRTLLHSLVPASIAARGTLLIVMVVVSVALPVLLAHHLWLQPEREQLEYEREAFLALALAAHMEADAAADATDKCDEWLTQIQQRSARVRWAGVFDREGRGLEFRRRTALPIAEILSQIDLTAETATSAPLVLNGMDSKRFGLLAIPQPEEGAVLAVILDRGDLSASPPAFALVGLLCAGLVGLSISAAWFRMAIQQPVQKMGRRLADVHAGLTEAALGGLTPRELSALARSVERTRDELKRSQSEAALLRHTVDARVDQRTRVATQAQRRAERDADTDALTRLASRRVLERDLPALFEEQVRQGAELTLVVVDVNNFKLLNDTRGHQAGDLLLSFIGDLIRATIRKGTDRAVRSGGDEFVLIMPGTTARQACAVTERITALFAQRVRSLADTEPLPGLSAGVASRKQHGAASGDELLQMADAAMYWAKRTGRGVATVRDAQTAPHSG